MKYLIICAHPNPASFNHAILQTVMKELKGKNKDVTVRDLYKLNFNPVLSTGDMVALQSGSVPEDIKKEQKYISSADTIIVIFPIWWSAMPAMLKGYIDRVFAYGFAFDITEDGAVGLFKGKKVFLISTTGATKENYEQAGAFEMMTNSIDRAIFQFTGMKVIEHKYFSAVPSVSDKERKQMLEEVKGLVRDKLCQHITVSQ